MSALKQLGAAQVQKRETTLNSLSSVVRAESGFTSNEAYAIEGVIQRTYGQLQTLDAKIQADTLIDVLRNDVVSVETSTRVGGVIDPVVHIALAADTLLREAGVLSNDVSNLSARIQTTLGINESKEESLLSSLQGDVSAMRSVGGSVAAQALQVTPSGYPGNQGTLTNLKADVVSAETGMAVAGQQDASQIGVCLTDDTSSQTC